MLNLFFKNLQVLKAVRSGIIYSGQLINFTSMIKCNEKSENVTYISNC